MPLVVKIILIVLAIVFGLAMIVFGISLLFIEIWLEYDADGFRSVGRIGPFRLDLAKVSDRFSEKHIEQSGGGVISEKNPKKPSVKGKLSEFQPLIRGFFEAFGKFIKHFRVHRLYMDLTVGGTDPFEIAMDYGKIAALVGTLFPLTKSVLEQKGTDINVGFDFALDETTVSCSADMRIRIIWFLAAVLGPMMKIRKNKNEKAVRV